MSSHFYTESGHAGYCRRHSRYLCEPCKRAEERTQDWALFTWRSDGHYTRGTALRVYKSRAIADRAAEKYVVVRPLERT
jgi:hypothetical protein